MRDDILEKAIESVRSHEPDPAAVEAAMRRAGEGRPASGKPAATVDDTPVVLRGCPDVQALVPAFVAGTLSPARSLLVEDHTRSCVPCRRVLKALRSGAPLGSGAAPAPASGRRSGALLAVAATLVGGAVLGAVWLVRSGSTTGPVARVDVVDGLLLSPEAGRPVAPGASVLAREAVRTGRSGGAVLVLSEGSRVEMAQRSEVSIARVSGGTRVALTRGRVIVNAAKQRGGHLFVKTSDCEVSVTGTVFSVARGTNGTRVSVLEGEVRVDDGRGVRVLRAGDQASTRRTSEPVALEEEFGWSRDRVALLELAGEVARVRKEMASTTAAWAGRTSTRLLDAMPDGTVVFAALPNVSGTVADFYERLAPRLAANPALSAWWSSGPGAAERQVEVKRLLDALRDWGSYLGDEVALGLGTGADGRPGRPLVLSTVVRSGFREFLESELARAGRSSKVRIVTSAAEAAPGEALTVWLRDDLVAVAWDGATLVGLEAALDSPGAFRGGTFHARLAEAYRDGVDVVVGVDLHSFVASASSAAGSSPSASGVLRASGLLDAEHLIVERRSTGEESSGRAALTFSSERHGLAAWLAPPSPMGALSFVSSGASGALAVVTKEPALLVDDLFAMFAAGSPEFEAKLAAFEAEHGVHVRADLAETLGGDVAFAVDGPLLPAPAWKLVAEVYDAPRLQATLEKLVALAADEARKAGKPAPSIATSEAGGLTLHSLVKGDGATPVQYAFVDGYLVAAPEKVLVLRAAETHRTGDTLLTAPKVKALLPKTGPLDFSMLAFQDVGGSLGALARGVGAVSGSASSELASAGASLAWAWAEPSRIVFGSAGTGLGDLPALLAATSALEPPRPRRR